MKVLIATPLYPPDIGGPAKYAQAIEEELKKRGIEAPVVVYTREGRNLSPGLRHAAYFWRLMRQARGAEFIFVLDTWSAGLPALFAAKLTGKKLVVRIGGDFLWEKYVERTGSLVKLSDFYTKPRARRLTAKEQVIFALTKFFVRRADSLLFNTLWQRDIWLSAYGFKKETSQLLENYYAGPDKKVVAAKVTTPVFVAATRGIKFKNINALGRAFAQLKKKYSAIALDTKPLPPAANRERLAQCYAVIIPSISEVNPNLVWEALTFDKPFICPLDSGSRERLDGLGMFVDTANEVELARAIEIMLDKKVYAAFVKKIKEFTFTHTWEQITSEVLAAAGVNAAAHSVALSAPVPTATADSGLCVLMISGDKKVLESGSGAHKRLLLQKSVVQSLEVFVWPQASGAWSILRAARRGRYTVVTSQDPFWRGLLAWSVAWRAGAQLNVQVHADLSGQSPFRRMLASFVLHRAQSVRVVSERVRRGLPKNLQARVCVLPVYVDLSPFTNLQHQQNPRFEKLLLWIGRFEKEKDPILALDIFGKVRAAGIDAGLVMLGAGSMEKELHAAVVERGLKGLVEFPGWQPPKEYLPYADAVLCTSVTESWGASIVEALASGVPTVAPDVGIAREAGAHIAPRERLAEKIIEVLQSGARGQLQLALLDEVAWARAWRETLVR